MSSRHNARKAAIQALYQWDITKQKSGDIEKHFKEIHDMQNVDKAYFRSILREVPEYQVELEEVLQPFLDREFSKIDPVERAILRVGAYELKYKANVPTKVIINEMIELAKVFGSDHSYKFVNGIMDKLSKAVRDKS